MFHYAFKTAYIWIPAVVAFGVYVFSLAPTISPEDGGELAAAAYVWGIPHPSGYPLWTFLAGAFLRVFAWAGEPAWLANLHSAVFGALTVGATALLARQLGATRLAAASGALALAFSLEFWEQSIIAEVYTLNASIMVLSITCLIHWARCGRFAFLAAACFIFGLGLGNHQSLALLTPLLLAYAIAVSIADPRLPVRHVAVGVAFAASGTVLIHLYLPLRALADPPMNWGDPGNGSRFRDVVSRAQFQHMLGEQPRSLGLFADQFGVFVKIYLVQFTPWVLPLALVGLVAGFVGSRRETVLLAGAAAVIALGAILVPNFLLERQWIWLNTTYWIPVYVLTAVLLARGIAAFPRWWMSAAVAGIAVASPFAMHRHHNDLSEYRFARDYGENLLHTMGSDAVYFGTGDHTLFPLLYLQIVENQRPDILIANPYGYPPAQVYSGMDAEFRARYEAHPHRVDEDAVWDWWLEHSDRPVYSPVRRPPGRRQVRHEGLLYAYLAPGAPASDRMWSEFEYQWHTLDPERAEEDWFARNILYEVFLAKARDAFVANDREDARAHAEKARNILADDPDGLNNLGALNAAYREYGDAIADFERALAIRPGMREARINLALALRIAGRADEAVELLEDWIALHPDDAETAEMLQKTRREQAPTPGENASTIGEQ